MRLGTWMTVFVALVGGCGAASESAEVEVESHAEELRYGRRRSPLFVSRDDSGLLATYIDGDGRGPRDLHDVARHPFFKSLGLNGRACVHCHEPSAGWSITPELAQLRFSNPLDLDDLDCLADATRCRPERDPEKFGLDPLFRPVDGANRPDADVSTADKRLDAYSLLLTKGLIRVGMPIPKDAEFTLAAVDDPYGYASEKELSLYRRPLPSTNLAAPGPDCRSGDAPVLSGVMWDARESFVNPDPAKALLEQANSATVGHAEAARNLTRAEARAIVDFESSIHTAQLVDFRAGDLRDRGAKGGPVALSRQEFYPLINDVVTGDPRTGRRHDPDVFDLYDSWKRDRSPERRRIARGQELFNRKRFPIRGVGGLNDDLGADTIMGTCSSCHDSPNYGHHSRPRPVDIGVSDGARRTADLPLYTLRNKKTGETVQTTDPGRALVTGKWQDIGRFKGPILRALSARAPYFHNGSAASLRDVVDFYDERFGIGFTDEEKRDLVAFLKAL